MYNKRKALREAKRNKKRLEEKGNKLAETNEKIYEKENFYTNQFKNEKERKKYLNDLLERHLNGEILSLRNADILCSSLRPELRAEHSICDDTIFIDLYLIHFDLTVKGEGLQEGAQLKLNQFIYDWEEKVYSKENSSDRIYIEVRKETKDTIKKLRKALVVKGLSEKEIKMRKKEVILKSKFTYIKVKRIIESLGTNELVVEAAGTKIYLDEFTLIHSFFRHYAEPTKQYDDGKTYFTREIFLEKMLPVLAEKIIGPIGNQAIFSILPQSIFIKYYGRLYRIYFKEKYLVDGKTKIWRVNSFYPVEHTKDLNDSKSLTFKKLNKVLDVGI